MTNEELVAEIQSGNEDLMLPLWNQVYRFIRMKAKILEQQLPPSFGVTSEDLIQSGYFALLTAINKFDAARGGSFISFLDYALRNEFARACGFSSEKRDALNEAESADVPAFRDDPDSPSVLDTIPDNRRPFECVEEQIYQEQLHSALDAALHAIPDKGADILRRRYCREQGLKDISEELGVSIERIRKQENEALRSMRKPQAAKHLEGFIEAHTDYYHGTGAARFSTSRTSSVERQVLKREALAEYWLTPLDYQPVFGSGPASGE